MPHGVFEATTLIEDGVISMLIDGSEEGLEAQVLDVGDAVLMPGVVDPHVHINEDNTPCSCRLLAVLRSCGTRLCNRTGYKHGPRIDRSS